MGSVLDCLCLAGIHSSDLCRHLRVQEDTSRDVLGRVSRNASP